MKKSTKRIIFGAVVSMLILAISYLCVHPHFIYIFGEMLGVKCEKVEMDIVVTTDMIRVSLEELKNDGRIQMQQGLMLINMDYPLQEAFEAELSQYKETNVKMNRCMLDAYEELCAAVLAKSDDTLYISSDYRTEEKQLEVFREDPSTAIKPGSSEHQAGLALDIYVPYYGGYGFIKTEAGQFVNSNSWEYGFIIRYPVFGKKTTDIKYEPWHIRYVGEPHAKIIYNNHITLEEYILSLNDGVWYETDGYLISRQRLAADETLSIPETYSNAVISPDNTGSYIITICCKDNTNNDKSDSCSFKK